MAGSVLITGGRCTACGMELRGINWRGDETRQSSFPVRLPAEQARASSEAGCGRCGGQVLLEMAEVSDG